MRAVNDDGSRSRLDDVGEMRRRKMLPNRANGGCGEDDVADLTEADKKDARVG
jgi:hypothetical protein